MNAQYALKELEEIILSFKNEDHKERLKYFGAMHLKILLLAKK